MSDSDFTEAGFQSEISRYIWSTKYRHTPAGDAPTERSVEDSWKRLAAALASVEQSGRTAHERDFLEVLRGFKFLPAGRILAGAGTERDTTLFNCFVMGHIGDSIEAIFDNLKEGALTMQWGGGIGCDFSTLRPSGTRAVASGTIASGPVSFMKIWDAMCATLLSTGARRGAMMGTLRCDHPDIESFIDAKRQAGALVNFNISVQVTDELMEAVSQDAEWPLCFPAEEAYPEGEVKQVRWPGRDKEVPCRVLKWIGARALWQRLMDSAYDSAEPGVLFVDRINRENNLYYREHITSTNPCGEIPLPPYGACDLGSINLTAFVREPFSGKASLDLEGIRRTAQVAVRMLDNVIDLSRYPLPRQAERARGNRRVGLGVTGLGDALIMLGQRYDSDAGRRLAADVLTLIRDTAYETSSALAEEKGPFPDFEREPYLEGDYIRSLPVHIRDRIADVGIRNSHLIAVAPTGTISLLANNVSSGIEPVYALEAERRVLDASGEARTHRTVDYALSVWERLGDGPLPAGFVTSADLAPEAHLEMLAALQPLVDNAISKTINVPESTPRQSFANLYRRAFELGLKGCTVFRPNPVTGAVLSSSRAEPAVHCCTPDREGD